MLGVVDYWNGIPTALRELGFEVYVTRVSNLHSTEERGAQLAEAIKDILQTSGAEKVNIIGHSHGGLDARLVAGEHPEWVASVTSVATPHQGALVADKVLDGCGPISTATTMALGAFGKIMAMLSGDDHEQDASESLKSLSTKHMKLFNQLYPQGLPREYCGEGEPVANGIRFYSWGGVQVRTNWLDFTDYGFSITALLDDRETDGLVERCSNHFGKVIRDDYHHNHLDLVNGMWGLVNNTEENPVDIFIQHARRLVADGV
jgi:triacylglycerol lipase